VVPGNQLGAGRFIAPAVLCVNVPIGRGFELGRIVERDLSESHAVLWSVVILASVFDIVTTIVGIGLLKFSALVLWAVLDDERATVVLAVFAVLSMLVVALNAITLAAL